MLRSQKLKVIFIEHNQIAKINKAKNTDTEWTRKSLIEILKYLEVIVLDKIRKNQLLWHGEKKKTIVKQ